MKRILLLALVLLPMFLSAQLCADEDTVRSNAASLITAYTARINGSVSHYSSPANVLSTQLRYVRVGQTDTATASASGTNPLRNLSGLQAATQYVYYYTSVCGSGTNRQLGTYTFTTLSAAVVYATERSTVFPYVKSDTGWVVPRQDTALFRQPSTTGGNIVFNPTDSVFYGYNKARWVPLMSSTAGISNKVDSVTVSGDSLFYWINGTAYGYILPAGSDINLANNGLTKDADTVKLGGTLTDTTTITQATFPLRFTQPSDYEFARWTNTGGTNSYVNLFAIDDGTIDLRFYSDLGPVAGLNGYIDNHGAAAFAEVSTKILTVRKNELDNPTFQGTISATNLTQNIGLEMPDSTGTVPLRIKAGASTYSPDSKGTIDISAGISGGTVTGTGTANTMTKWTGTSAIGNSSMFDDGTNVGINKTSSFAAKFDVLGSGTAAATMAARFVAGTSAAAGGLYIGSYSATYGGLWSNNITPSTSNYSLIADGSNTYIQGGGTVNFTANTNSISINNNNTTFGRQIVQSAAGAASTPALSLTGAWLRSSSAGVAQMLIQESGATAYSIGSANGNGLVVNAASGFTGNLLHLTLNNVNRLSLDKDGHLTINGNASVQNIALATATVGGWYQLTGNSSTSGLFFGSQHQVNWGSSTINTSTAKDIGIGRASAGVLEVNNGTAGTLATLTASRALSKQGADVASTAGAMTLGTDGTSFEITGTNSITLLSNIGWVNGNEVTLMFTGAATLVNGTATSGTNIMMNLAGGVDFVATAGDIITLILMELGGTQIWREKCRSVN